MGQAVGQEASMGTVYDSLINESDDSMAIMTTDRNGVIKDCFGPDDVCREMIARHMEDLVEREKSYVLIAPRKYIDTIRSASLEVFSSGREWGLNEMYREDNRVAYNESHNMIPTSEIRAILERCREFVMDNDKPINEIDVTLSVYHIGSRKSLASAEVRKAQEVVERLERETELRRDIDELLKRLTSE
jgi:hypothetical protein